MIQETTKAKVKAKECKVCMMEHDEEIHDATLSVRHWFAWQVTKHFEEFTAPVQTEVNETAA
jgi:hypothetical protein